MPLVLFIHHLQGGCFLTLDGVGEWTTTSYGYANDTNLNFDCQIQFPHSLGLLYSAFTYYLGFKVNSGEYKMMGLAPTESQNIQI